MNAFGGMFATAAGYHHQDPYSRMMVGDAAMGVHAAAAAHHAHAMHHHQVQRRIYQLPATNSVPRLTDGQGTLSVKLILIF